MTKWTKWSLYFQIGISIIALISGAFEYNLLQDFKNNVYPTQAEMDTAATANDIRQGGIGILQVIIFVVSGFLILKSIYRANFNARQLGVTDMRFTPGWSIGWYFIPIANLWRPYQAMKEIWKVSASPSNWKNQPVSSVLGWWWFFWIISNMVDNASMRLALKAEQMNELIALNVVTLLSDITTLPLCFIFLAIVRRIYEMQMSHFKKI